MQLSIAKKLTYDLLKAENLLQKGWHCKFDDSKKRLGCCRYASKEISLSRYFIALNPDSDTLDTIRHEVAHALTPGDAHGEIWKREAVRLGATPVACASDVIAPTAQFVGTCPNCGCKSYKHRVVDNINRLACGFCCKTLNAGIYDPRFVYVWRNLQKGEIYENGLWIKDVDAGSSHIDTSVAESFISEFGFDRVIEMNEIGKLVDFQFADYSFKDTPEGIFTAFLEVKIWRQIKSFTVLRTFWQTSDGNGIIIDIWENMSSGKYETADRRVDMEKQKIGFWYELIVMANPKGYLRLQTVKIIK